MSTISEARHLSIKIEFLWKYLLLSGLLYLSGIERSKREIFHRGKKKSDSGYLMPNYGESKKIPEDDFTILPETNSECSKEFATENQATRQKTEPHILYTISQNALDNKINPLVSTSHQFWNHYSRSFPAHRPPLLPPGPPYPMASMLLFITYPSELSAALGLPQTKPCRTSHYRFSLLLSSQPLQT